jgi:hypothetical protein
MGKSDEKPGFRQGRPSAVKPSRERTAALRPLFTEGLVFMGAKIYLKDTGIDL